MEFHEKLQQLRKQKGLTQEELAQALFVSRTAVSKWESGRGYPNIDSLKAIAKLFSVSVDDLLSGEQLLTVAQEDRKQTKTHLEDLVFGLSDAAALLLLILPLLGQQNGDTAQAVSLIGLRTGAFWLRFAYWDMVSSLVLCGILTLAFQLWQPAFWGGCKRKLSLLLSVLAVVLFIIGRQPYAACFLFVFLMIKVLLLLKKA